MIQKNDQNEGTVEVSRQAAYWCLRIKDERRLSLEDGLQFIAWLTRSRRHVHEFLLLRRLDSRMTRLMRATQDQSNVTHVNWWRGSSLYQPEMQGRRRISGWRVAATVLVLLPAIVFLARTNEDTLDRTVTTAAHESKTSELQDGSRVSIESNSTVHVEFTELRRDVQLLQGKAMFDVVMDMKRPFVVSTSLVDIATVESKFSVTIDTSVEVMVSEGMVAISGRGAKIGTPVVTVRKGETYRVPVEGFRAIVANGGRVVRMTRVDG